MINLCTFIGSVGQTPETKIVGETKVSNFSVACNESWKDKNGEKKEKTEWIRITAWGKLAEIVEKWVTKGQLIYVEGKMETRSYDKDGQTHYQTSINANTIKMLGGKKDHTSETAPFTAPTDSETNSTPTKDTGKEGDDLPF